jgi:omega-6 fatty acid desaturase (delta-12 desaturase)
MNTSQTIESSVSDKLAWRQAVAKYQQSDTRRSYWQVVNTLLPYFVLWYLMYRSLAVSYWLTLLLAIPAAGFMVRTFIIFHDCGHGSFFNSRKANDVLGFITGVLTFTPYYHWRHDHAIHHATAGDLDRRGVGDVMVLTVDEYLELPSWKRLGYRFLRNPFVMFAVGPLIVFLIVHRFAHRTAGKRERYSVIWTNLILLGILVFMGLTIGIKAFVLVHLPILVLGTSFGVWLFYVQHQFEGVYWERHENWSFSAAGLQGSSFYQLPKLLQWFTGNIGFHHIHHLSPRIPNYFLERCHNENPVFDQVKPLTFLSSLKSLTFRLWDEKNRKLVGYSHLKIAQG